MIERGSATISMTVREKGFVPFACVGAVVVLAVWLIRGERHLWGLYGPHEYWATIWATDYSNGFVNRGLLGEILKHLAIDNTNYLVITAASWLVMLGLFAVILKYLWQLTKDHDVGISMCLLVAVLFSPAISGLLIETMGDSVQVLLLVHLLAAPLLLDGRVHPIIVGAIYAVLGAGMVLVHEASIFFFVPWLAIQVFVARKTNVSRAALIGYGLASAGVVAILVARGFSSGGAELPMLHYGAQEHIYGGRLAPPFATILKEEFGRMFGDGLIGYIKTALRLLGAVLLPVLLAGLVTAAMIGTERKSLAQWRKHALLFAVLAVCIGPLVLIAHDWGRWFSYVLILFLATLATMKTPRADNVEADAAELKLPLAGALVLGGLTTTMTLRDYRMDGLFENPPILAACILLIGLFATLAFMARRSRSANTGGSDAPSSTSPAS